MFQLRCPILRKYWTRDGTCVVNQFFGQNRTDFYAKLGTKGHTGIDLKTQGNLRFWTSTAINAFIRNEKEKVGLIDIQATHDGFLTIGKNSDRLTGISMRIESPEMEEDGQTVKYETLYFHLDETYLGKNDEKLSDVEKEFGENFVKAGTLIGRAGNTGKYTTGAHLHFELRKFIKKGNKWVNPNEGNGYWGAVDPLPYFMSYVIFEWGDSLKDYYHLGKRITKEQVKLLTKKV